MTTIAYRAGIIAADTLVTAGAGVMGTMTKIGRRADGTFYGANGPTGFIQQFLAWAAHGVGDAPLPRAIDRDVSEGSGVVIPLEGPPIWFLDTGRQMHADAPFYAWGCGAAEARGAMAVGADAEAAVKAAASLDVHTGGEITVLRRDLSTNDLRVMAERTPMRLVPESEA